MKIRIASVVLLLLSLFSTKIIAQYSNEQVVITKAVEYNDYIINLQNEIGNELLSFLNVFSDPKTTKEIANTELERVKNTTLVSIGKLKKLKPISNEFGLKDASLELFKFYYNIMKEDYAAVIAEVYSAKPDSDKINAMVKKVQDEEKVFDLGLKKAQSQFAKFHNIDLKENELQEKLNK